MRSHSFGRFAVATATREPSAAIDETVPVVPSIRVTGVEAEAPDTAASARAASAATPVRMLQRYPLLVAVSLGKLVHLGPFRPPLVIENPPRRAFSALTL
jgi:hypothetical protein